MATKRRTVTQESRPRTSTQVNATGVVNLVRHTVVTALDGARDVGAEVGSVAVSAVRGSIQAASVIGGDVGRLATNAAEGTIDAAGRITAAAGRAVGNLMHGTIEGVKDIVRPERTRAAITRRVSVERGRAAAEDQQPARRKPLARRAGRRQRTGGRAGRARTAGAA